MASSKIPLAQSLARFTKISDLTKIPRARKIRLLWFLADYIACIIAASDLREANTAFILAEKGSIRIPGLPKYSFSPAGVAIAAGALGSLLQLHDGYGKGGNHPSSVLVPALIGSSNKHSLTSLKSISALGAGYEICNRLAALTHPNQSFLGSAPTGTMGAIGAAVVAGICMNLNQKKLAEAISIAAFLAPLSAFEALKVRGSAVPLHNSFAARTGIESAKLAFNGFSGGSTVLEGRPQHPGILNFLKGERRTDKNPSKPINNTFTLNTHHWKFKTIDQVYFKPFPGCRHIQPAVEAVIACIKDYRPKPEDIISIQCFTYPLAIAFAKAPRKSNELYDRLMSIPWGIAMTILKGKPTVESLKENNKKIANQLYKITEIQTGQKYSRLYPKELGASIKIILKNNRVLKGECLLAYGKTSNPRFYTPSGSTQKPLTEEDMPKRFLSLTAPVIGKSKANQLLEDLNPQNNKLIGIG